MKVALVVFAVLAFVAVKVNAEAVICTGDVPEDKVEFHPHPCNCNTYYVCMGTDPVPMPCPSGLYWNRMLDKCDWPNKAKCKIESYCPKPI